MTSNLVLHCGGERATRVEVEAIPVPRQTDSWRPVSYADAIGLMHETIADRLKLPIVKEAYGLNAEGLQLFALFTLDTGNPEHGLSIGLRQSYNKSLALGVAVGAQVFVCDNLAFRGDAFEVVRKNTVNVWRDFRAMVEKQAARSLEHYANLENDVKRMKAAPCDLTRGYELLGTAYGQGLLTTKQATIAFEDWKEPRHEDFADRNLWGFYNATTEALKKGTVANVIDRHAAMHGFVMAQAA